MNVIAFCSDPKRSTIADANDDEVLDLDEDSEDLVNDHSERRFPGEVVTVTRFSRLIDASCTAFFLKRGLDPDVDRYPGVGGGMSEVEHN